MSINYLREIVLACAFTSVSVHLLNQRRDAKTERLRYTAQVGALEDVVQRLRTGEMVSDAELAKIRRRVGLLKREGAVSKPVEWTDKFVKRKEPRAEMTDEQVFSEWNKAVKEASEDDQRSPSLLQALFRGQTVANDPVFNAQTRTDTSDQNSTQNGQPSKKPVFL